MFQSLRWKILINCSGNNVRNRDVLYSVLSGIAIGSVTPGKVGEIGKALFVKNIDKKTLFTYAVYEKIYSFFIIILFGIISLFFLKNRIFVIDLPFDYIINICLLLLVVLLLFVLMKSDILFIRLFNLRIVKKFKIYEKLNLYINNIPNFRFFLVSIVTFFVFSVQFLLLILSFENSEIFITLNSVFFIYFAKHLFPISIGDLGVREALTILTLSSIGIGKSAAFNSSMLLFLINIVIPAVFGSILMIKYK